MDNEQLQKFFDIHKFGQIEIKHSWNEKMYNTTISLKDLLRLIKFYIKESEYLLLHENGTSFKKKLDFNNEENNEKL